VKAAWHGGQPCKRAKCEKREKREKCQAGDAKKASDDRKPRDIKWRFALHFEVREQVTQVMMTAGNFLPGLSFCTLLVTDDRMQIHTADSWVSTVVKALRAAIKPHFMRLSAAVLIHIYLPSLESGSVTREPVCNCSAARNVAYTSSVNSGSSVITTQ
jgi:hypothetical protein